MLIILYICCVELFLPRVEYLKRLHATDVSFLVQYSAMHLAMSLLPDNLFWINTMGAYFNPNNNKGLVSRVHIQHIPTPIVLAKTAFVDGPYLSEEHLQACSPAYNLIINPNPAKATQILLKSVCRKRKEIYDKYFTNDFIENMSFMLEHTFVGHHQNGAITGVHYNTSDVRLKKPINSSLKSKSPFFLIEKMNPLTNEVLPKTAPSTFWPAKWDIEKCIIECAIAWSNKTPIVSDIHAGYTSDGLKIKFCYRGSKLKTVYPDQSNNQ